MFASQIGRFLYLPNNKSNFIENLMRNSITEWVNKCYGSLLQGSEKSDLHCNVVRKIHRQIISCNRSLYSSKNLSSITPYIFFKNPFYARHLLTWYSVLEQTTSYCCLCVLSYKYNIYSYNDIMSHRKFSAFLEDAMLTSMLYKKLTGLDP